MKPRTLARVFVALVILGHLCLAGGCGLCRGIGEDLVALGNAGKIQQRP